MYTIQMACINQENKLKGILIKKDSKVIHDIYKIIKGDTLYILDDNDETKKVILKMAISNTQTKTLRRIEGTEDYIQKNSKVTSVKYNKNSITVNYVNREVTINDNRNTIFTKYKIKKKGNGKQKNVRSKLTKKAEVNNLIDYISDCIGIGTDNPRGNMHTSLKVDISGDVSIVRAIGINFAIDTEEVYNMVYNIIMRSVESLAIFL